MLRDIITSEIRVKIILELFSNFTPIHIRELTRRVGTEINAVRRELLRLQKCGMLKKEVSGNRVLYSVRKDYISYHEILSLVSKETGLGGLVLKNLNELGKVKFALLSSAFVEGRISQPNEVDLLLIGTIDVNYLQGLIKKVQEEIGHEVNYTVLGEEEYFFRCSRRDPFVLNILLQGRIILFGSETKYCSIS